MTHTDAPVIESLVCPNCTCALTLRSGELVCSECGHAWPIVDGIPSFIQDSRYAGELPLEDLRQLNSLSRTRGWKAALLDSSSQMVREAAPAIHNLERANWYCLLDLPTDSLVLDIGAGLGATSHALSLHYRKVIAVEPELEQIRFLQQRITQENLSNVELLQSSVWCLPFARGSFDLVAMDGILGRLPEGREGEPAALQERALRTVHGLLRSGGYLYLGVENRFSIRYFMGAPDPYSGLPFVAVLPRALARWYARSRSGSDFRSYMHSSRGYRRLLAKSGFTKVEVYLALPDYKHARFLLPPGRQLFEYYSRNFNSGGGTTRFRRIIQRTLLTLGVLQEFESSFVILAQK